MAVPTYRDAGWRNSIETLVGVDQQDTQPLPLFKVVYVYGGLLTVRQVREACGLNQVQLAKAASVRPIVVDWFERGVKVRRDEAARLLNTLAERIRGARQDNLLDLWKGGQR